MADDHKEPINVTEEILKEGCIRFGVEPVTGKDLSDGSPMSCVYECTRSSSRVFLKFFQPIKGSIDGSEEQLDHVKRFSEESTDDIRFASPLPSKNGRLAELIDDVGYHVYLVESAPGTPHENCVPSGADGLEQVRKMGRLGGRIHYLAKTHPLWRYRDEETDPTTESYATGATDSFGRCRDGRALFLSLITRIDDAEIEAEVQNLLSRMAELPKTREYYGFVNFDMNWTNFMVHGDTWTVIDFTGAYNWFLSTVAGAIYYMEKLERDRHLGYWDTYREGYERECQVDRWWWHLMPLFLEERRLAVYVIMDGLRNHPRYRAKPEFDEIMKERREIILRHEPLVEFDFSV